MSTLCCCCRAFCMTYPFLNTVDRANPKMVAGGFAPYFYENLSNGLRIGAGAEQAGRNACHYPKAKDESAPL